MGSQNKYRSLLENGVGTLFGPQICGDALDNKGDLILTGSYRGSNQIELWSLQQRALVCSMDWDEGKKSYESASVCSAMFDKKLGENIVAGTAGKNEVKMIEHYGDITNTVVRVSNLPKSCFSVDISTSGAMMAFGCGDGKLRLLDIGDKKSTNTSSFPAVKT